MVLTAYFALSPVTGLFCHRHFRELPSRKLNASVGASGPHDFAVRIWRRSSTRYISVHRIPPHVRDDRETPLRGGGTELQYSCFYLVVKRNFRKSEIDHTADPVWLAQAGDGIAGWRSSRKQLHSRPQVTSGRFGCRTPCESGESGSSGYSSYRRYCSEEQRCCSGTPPERFRSAPVGQATSARRRRCFATIRNISLMPPAPCR